MNLSRYCSLSLAAVAAVLFMAPALANGYSDESESEPESQPAAAVENEILGDVERGEMAYAEDCASCHRTPARFMANVPGEYDAARAEWLEEFLPEHYAPDAQARADIIAWLLAD
ncbi:MAG: hypothetical protein JJT95_02255 [Pararhodobacter sp.]|nr:hypothetical protein [Pararhodobacter sp.]